MNRFFNVGQSYVVIFDSIETILEEDWRSWGTIRINLKCIEKYEAKYWVLILHNLILRKRLSTEKLKKLLKTGICISNKRYFTATLYPSEYITVPFFSYELVNRVKSEYASAMF